MNQHQLRPSPFPLICSRSGLEEPLSHLSLAAKFTGLWSLHSFCPGNSFGSLTTQILLNPLAQCLDFGLTLTCFPTP